MTDQPFTVIPLGVGDAFSAKWYQTTFLLVAGGRHTLVDIPDPPRKALAEACAAAGVASAFDRIDDLVLTHVHGDHANGVEAYGFWKLFAEKRKARLWTIPEVAGPLWDEKLKAGMGGLYNADFSERRRMSLTDYFDVRTLAFDSINEVNGLKVEIFPTRHHVPCFAVRAEYAGRRWGYSCDTCYLPALIDWLAPCDLIFHETNYGTHTPYAKLAALPADLRRRMRLVHYPDDFDIAGSVIECARPGQAYVV